MKYTQLGRTGLKVSRLVLGTMNFGPQTDEADSHAHHGRGARRGHQLLRHRQRLRLGREQGPHRGDHRHLVRQGRRPARQDRPGHQGLRRTWPRDGRPPGPTTTSSPRSTSAGPSTPASSGSRPTTSTSTSSTTSTARTPFEEIWQADRRPDPAGQDPLRRVLATSPATRSPRPTRPPPARGTLGLVSEQCLYNLAERRAEMEVIPAAQEYGLGVIPWSPLHGGLLGGVIKKEVEGGAPRERPGRGRARQHRRTRADPGVRGPARQARPRARRGRPWPGC